MPIYPGSLQISYDFSDPTCYSGSGNTVFSLVGGYSGSVGSGVAFTTENGFGFFRFNDANAFDNIVTTFNVVSNQNFTFNVWCRPSTNVISVAVFAGDNGNGTGPYISYNAGWPSFSETWLFSAGFGNGTINPSTSFYANNEWYMISYTQDGTTGKLFVNGVLLGTGNATGVSLPGASTVFSLGGNPSAGSPDYSWTGDIAIGQLYSSVLSDAQILNIYNESRYRFQKQLEYDFQNGSYPGSGTSIFDLSGNGITANILSGGTYVTGNVNYIDLQGNTNIFAANANIPTNTSLTINAWVQPEFQYPSSGYGNWWSTGNDGNGTIPFLALSNVGGTNVIVSGGFGAGTTQSFNPLDFDPTNWYYYSAVSSSATGTSLFINGTLVGTNPGWIRPQTANFRIGKYDDPTSATNGFGKIAYVDFYNVALTSAEILANYNASAGIYDNLVAKYDLNDPLSYSGTGSTLFDLTPNNYDITLDYGPTYHTYSGYNALEFNRTSGTTATRVGSLGLGTSSPKFTFALWVKPIDLTNPVNYSWFFSYGKENGAIGGAPMILAQYNGPLNLTSSFGSARAMYQSGIALTTNEWAFLTTTCDGTNHKLYLNGTFLGQAALSGAQIETPEVLAINYLTGTSIGLCTFELNYLEIYDKALSVDAINEIYNNTVSRFAPAPPAYQGIVGGRQFAQGFNG